MGVCVVSLSMKMLCLNFYVLEMVIYVTRAEFEIMVDISYARQCFCSFDFGAILICLYYFNLIHTMVDF